MRRACARQSHVIRPPRAAGEVEYSAHTGCCDDDGAPGNATASHAVMSNAAGHGCTRRVKYDHSFGRPPAAPAACHHTEIRGGRGDKAARSASNEELRFSSYFLYSSSFGRAMLMGFDKDLPHPPADLIIENPWGPRELLGPNSWAVRLFFSELVPGPGAARCPMDPPHAWENT